MNERAETRRVGKEYLGSIIAECFRQYHTTQTSMILDKIKELGFTYSTKAGITIAVSDVIVPTEKVAILKESEEKVKSRYESIPSWFDYE